MKRTIINIDEELCNGCGICVEGCHEGALQMVDGKARMISDLYCDGLGACIPDCPVGAISLEEREAEPYDEIKVMERIAPKGEATVRAHLNHLIDHNQHTYVREGIDYINKHNIPVDISKLKQTSNQGHMQDQKSKANKKPAERATNGAGGNGHQHGGGCPGSKMVSFDAEPGSIATATAPAETSGADQPSALRQWPVQLHLVSPQAPYFQNADVLLAADCVAFSMGDFHSKHLKGKGLAIACPKLDQGTDIYLEKLTAMINDAHINTLTVMMMEVPCCGGLLRLAKKAAEQADRKVPVKAIKIGVQGNVINEEWV